MPGPLADTAWRFGGEIVKDFRQGDVESYGWINLDPQTREGACMALSCWWIVKTKKREDFFAWVVKPSGIKTINNMQTDPRYATHDNRIENRIRFFEANGLKRSANAQVNIDPFDVQRVAMQIYQGDGYKQITFRGDAGGHAVAASVSDYECWFFDPNYGLAWFNQRLQFAYWFVAFWKAATFYNMNLGDYCRILQVV